MKKNIISAYIEKTKAYPLGTRWLRFQAFCRLPIIGLLYTAASVSMFIKGEESQVLTALCFALNGVLSLCALLPTLRLRPSAYTLNIAVAVAMMIYGAVSMNIMVVGLEALEICYFIKRKNLFFSSN